jgi:hypothetical protein
VRYADVAHAAVEVEFAPPPAAEVLLLDPGAAGSGVAGDPDPDDGQDVAGQDFAGGSR